MQTNSKTGGEISFQNLEVDMNRTYSRKTNSTASILGGRKPLGKCVFIRKLNSSFISRNSPQARIIPLRR